MAESTLIINGSPRDGGNTDAILHKLIEGAKTSRHVPVYRKLRELNIFECIGCCRCRDESECQHQDDMSFLRRDIENAELLVFATPNYWCMVTGLMKVLIDRLYFYHHPTNSALVSGKKAIILSTMGEATNIKYESSLLIEFFNRVMGSLQIEILDVFLFYGLMEKDDVITKSEYIELAFDLGRKLVSY